VIPANGSPEGRTARAAHRAREGASTQEAHKEHTVADRLFFSTKGINWDDDESIEAFARTVWQQAADEFTKDEPDNDATENNEEQGEQDV